MKFYYIDDSYFRDSAFLLEMRKRLFHLCQKQDVHMIFVSGSDAHATGLDNFLSMCHDFDIQVLMSPATFEIDDVKGVLNTTSLEIQGCAPFQSYSGSLIYYDSNTCEYERYYLELFLKHETDAFVDVLSDELEEVLKELIHKKRSSKNSQYN